MLSLVAPSERLHVSVLEALTEHAREGSLANGLASGYLTAPEDADVFRRWTEILRGMAAKENAREFRWLVNDDTYLGAVSLQLRLLSDEERQYAGQVGYSVRPSARRRGHASRLLDSALARAYAVGIDELLVVTTEGNVGSMRTIERAGGERIDERPRHETGQVFVRYRLRTSASTDSLSWDAPTLVTPASPR